MVWDFIFIFLREAYYWLTPLILYSPLRFPISLWVHFYSLCLSKNLFRFKLPNVWAVFPRTVDSPYSWILHPWLYLTLDQKYLESLVQWHVPMVPGIWELKQEDHLSSWVWDQPGPFGESPLTKRKEEKKVERRKLFVRNMCLFLSLFLKQYSIAAIYVALMVCKYYK